MGLYIGVTMLETNVFKQQLPKYMTLPIESVSIIITVFSYIIVAK